MALTLGSKLEEIEKKSASQYRHPLMDPFVKFYNDDEPNREKVLRSTDVYPGLGLQSMAKASGPVPYPVSGPSLPQCGHRATDHTSDKFVGLSCEMATYNYNRTAAIQKGARAGC